MAYENEIISSLLKEARKAKGLSQRELAMRSGVPQSHISKIEASFVDLRVSSLFALASALDLELVLVPRKASPAVHSILRSTMAGNSVNELTEQESKPAYHLEDEEDGDV